MVNSVRLGRACLACIENHKHSEIGFINCECVCHSKKVEERKRKWKKKYWIVIQWDHILKNGN